MSTSKSKFLLLTSLDLFNKEIFLSHNNLSYAARVSFAMRKKELPLKIVLPFFSSLEEECVSCKNVKLLD